MIYLGNNHIGFDPAALVYPSISGCHAVMYLTDNGMFGLHNFGGADPGSWEKRAAAFGTFFTNHMQGSGTGRALYGVCFATGGNSRGYGVGTAARENWLKELSWFAKKVNFKGPIYGYDLSQQMHPPSVTVSYTRTGSTAVIQVKKYHATDDTKGPNTAPANHQMIRRDTGTGNYVLQATETQVVISTTNAGWKTAYPETLRG